MVPGEWINDGYCDCPLDGIDEPDTDACSGSANWAGIDTAGRIPATNAPVYACPQQPDLLLPLSRMNDEICDCCDGSDENNSDNSNGGDSSEPGSPPACPDVCETVLRAEKARRARVVHDYLVGSRKRAVEIARFSELRASKAAEVALLEDEREELSSRIASLEATEIPELVASYAASRTEAWRAVAAAAAGVFSPADDGRGSGAPLGETLLERVLVHLCQVAGEIAAAAPSGGGGRDDDNGGDPGTCAALRLAALDLGLSWSDKDVYGDEQRTDPNEAADETTGAMRARFRNVSGSEIAAVLFENAIGAKPSPGDTARVRRPPPRWTVGGEQRHRRSGDRERRTPGGRRRLDESGWDDDEIPIEDMDDTYFGDSKADDDDDDDYSDNEDDSGDGDGNGDGNGNRDDDNDDDEQEEVATGKQKEYMDEIQNSLFSVTRSDFLEESRLVLDEIDRVLRQQANQTEDNSSKDATEGRASEEERIPPNNTIDVAAYRRVRKRLRSTRASVLNGLRWGASAKLLLGVASEEFTMPRATLERLLIGTVYYGQIGALQTWQILQTTVVLSSGDDDQNGACASPWAKHCPPRELFEGYPPSCLLGVARVFCDEELSRFSQHAGAVLACETTPDQENNEIVRRVLETTTDEESGFSCFAHKVPEPRDPDTDPLRFVFEAIDSLPVDAEGLARLETEAESKRNRRDQISREIDRIWKEAGGPDGTDLGRDGELHQIANECLTIDAGKYTYELCLFGGAKQKDGGSSTNLGRWKGITYHGNDNDDDDDGSRVLSWEDGDRCWNGPNRSATVVMKCGTDNKLVSADEPDTCRYVFEMETYLACDDAYKARAGL